MRELIIWEVMVTRDAILLYEDEGSTWVVLPLNPPDEPTHR